MRSSKCRSVAAAGDVAVAAVVVVVPVVAAVWSCYFVNLKTSCHRQRNGTPLWSYHGRPLIYLCKKVIKVICMGNVICVCLRAYMGVCVREREVRGVRSEAALAKGKKVWE